MSVFTCMNRRLKHYQTRNKDVITKLKKHGFHAHCFLDEAEFEYRALFISFSAESETKKNEKEREVVDIMWLVAISLAVPDIPGLCPTLISTGLCLHWEWLVA